MRRDKRVGIDRFSGLSCLYPSDRRMLKNAPKQPFPRPQGLAQSGGNQASISLQIVARVRPSSDIFVLARLAGQRGGPGDRQRAWIATSHEPLKAEGERYTSLPRIATRITGAHRLWRCFVASTAAHPNRLLPRRIGIPNLCRCAAKRVRPAAPNSPRCRAAARA